MYPQISFRLLKQANLVDESSNAYGEQRSPSGDEQHPHHLVVTEIVVNLGDLEVLFGLIGSVIHLVLDVYRIVSWQDVLVDGPVELGDCPVDRVGHPNVELTGGRVHPLLRLA